MTTDRNNSDLMKRKVPCPACCCSAWHQGLCAYCIEAIKYKYNNCFWMEQLSTIKRFPTVLSLPLTLVTGEPLKDAWEGFKSILFYVVVAIPCCLLIPLLFPILFPFVGLWEWASFRRFLKKKFPEAFEEAVTRTRTQTEESKTDER